MTLTNTDEVKTGEQIVLQNRFWNEDTAAFFVGIHCTLCFTDEGDSEVEDAGDTNENPTEGEDQPPSKVRKILSRNFEIISFLLMFCIVEKRMS